MVTFTFLLKIIIFYSFWLISEITLKTYGPQLIYTKMREREKQRGLLKTGILHIYIVILKLAKQSFMTFSAAVTISTKYMIFIALRQKMIIMFN